MKRATFWILALGTLSFVVPAFAEEGGPEGGPQKKMKGGMMHQQPSVTATTDGGVVVLAGPRLLKYDADLNLVGEAELKMGPKPGSQGEAKPEGEEPPPAPEEA